MIYRTAEDALRRRRDELLLEKQLEVAALPEAVSSVYVRRRARRDAGIAGVICAAVLVLAAALRQPGLTGILNFSWLCVTGIYLLSRAVARLRIRQALAGAYAPSVDVEDDVLRFSETRPAQVVKDMADSLEWSSIALPMTAAAMLAPLSLHWLLMAVLSFGPPQGREFDGWISLSLLCVGHCHILLALRAWQFADRVRAAPDVLSIGLIADRSGWAAWGIIVGASAAAGLFLFAVGPFFGLSALVLPIAGMALLVVAPVVVAITGLAFIPGMFARMGRRIREERLLLSYPGRWTEVTGAAAPLTAST